MTKTYHTYYNDDRSPHPTTRSKRMATAQQAKSLHQADIKMIAERMEELAETHDWCNEFYEEVKRLNARLSVPLPVTFPTANGSLRLAVTIRLADVPIDEEEGVEDGVVEDIVKAIERALDGLVLDDDADIERVDVEFDDWNRRY
jgi:tellurite resistance protein